LDADSREKCMSWDVTFKEPSIVPSSLDQKLDIVKQFKGTHNSDVAVVTGNYDERFVQKLSTLFDEVLLVDISSKRNRELCKLAHIQCLTDLKQVVENYASRKVIFWLDGLSSTGEGDVPNPILQV
jgi:hypothetical protein